jgi:DMSO reductase anchor subunit
VFTTGMIYGSLRTIRGWHEPLVPAVYLALAIATGGVLAVTLLALFGAATASVVLVAVLCVAGAGLLKALYWSRMDQAPRPYTIESATGLGRFGEVRPLDPPHSRPNYVMREMGYTIARKHAAKLRRLSVLAAFVAPVACLLLALLVGSAELLALLSLVAVAAAAAGVAMERWLFFAEAEHVSMLYYGRREA